MLTDADIQQLIKEFSRVFTTREEIDQRFDEMRQDFSDLQTSVDGYAKKVEICLLEILSLSHRDDRHEKWIRQLAKKAGVGLGA